MRTVTLTVTVSGPTAQYKVTRKLEPLVEMIEMEGVTEVRLVHGLPYDSETPPEIALLIAHAES